MIRLFLSVTFLFTLSLTAPDAAAAQTCENCSYDSFFGTHDCPATRDGIDCVCKGGSHTSFNTCQSHDDCLICHQDFATVPNLTAVLDGQELSPLLLAGALMEAPRAFSYDEDQGALWVRDCRGVLRANLNVDITTYTAARKIYARKVAGEVLRHFTVNIDL